MSSSDASAKKKNVAPRGPAEERATREGAAPILASPSLQRLRSESFNSDDGEELSNEDLGHGRGQSAKPATASAPTSSPSAGPVDMAVLLAPELGVQVCNL